MPLGHGGPGKALFGSENGYPFEIGSWRCPLLKCMIDSMET